MVILGREISEKAEKFVEENESLLAKIEFRDISGHWNPNVRRLDGAHDFQGSRHIVWINLENPDFEQFLMHEIMHGVLINEGFPKTARPPDLNDDEQTHYIGSLLNSVVTDTIIDNHLMESCFVVFNRDKAIQLKIAQTLFDSKTCKGIPYGFCFCKWAMISFHACIDNTFTENQRKELYSAIEKKFAQALKLGKSLCEKIKKEGLSTQQKALNAMIILRNSLKLNRRVIIVDSQGRIY